MYGGNYLIGVVYFFIIILANTVGAISGMGGGVIIKPIFDLIDFHSVVEISFYSSMAVLTMSMVSTYRQIKNGMTLEWLSIIQISAGAIVGGILGNQLFEKILMLFPNGREVQLVQISLTILTLVFAFLHSQGMFVNHSFKSGTLKIITGLILGFLASLLGIGGGPINVALLMFFFNMPIKDATVYSIVTIFFSQLSKIITIFLTTDLSRYDFNVLIYIIPAAIIGGFLGAYFSHVFSDEKVRNVYKMVIVIVLLINVYNALQLY